MAEGNFPLDDEADGIHNKHNNMLMMRILGPVIHFVNRSWKVRFWQPTNSWDFGTEKTVDVPSRSIVWTRYIFTCRGKVSNSTDTYPSRVRYSVFYRTFGSICNSEERPERSTNTTSRYSNSSRKESNSLALAPNSTDISLESSCLQQG